LSDIYVILGKFVLKLDKEELQRYNLRMNNLELKKRDLDVLWHPCTQMKDHETLPLIPIKKAHGVYLEDFDGNRYIDAVSSWWVNMFGHTNEYINKKIKEQLDTLEHVMLAGFTHEQVVRLSERLVKLTPKGLDKCFYSDNGSSAVEVALKMSYHAHLNDGKKNKTTFVSLSNSYHGETIGALSVGDVELYKDTYAPILLETIQTPVPVDMSVEAAISAAKQFELLCQKSAKNISAIIVEPLIQGAGYMHMYHSEYLRLIREICNTYDVHLIADEVMVGFGRTGKLFACEHANITPDFIVLSKGLTGGYLPLSVVLTSNEIYAKFYCDYGEYKAFLHSHSYTGNALACAAGNATLDIFESENIIEKNEKLAEYMEQKLKSFEGLSNVKEVRQTGMVCAIELKGYTPQERVNVRVYQYGLAHGVLLRPLGHVVYLMPPYTITPEEIDIMMDVTLGAINSL